MTSNDIQTIVTVDITDIMHDILLLKHFCNEYVEKDLKVRYIQRAKDSASPYPKAFFKDRDYIQNHGLFRFITTYIHLDPHTMLQSDRRKEILYYLQLNKDVVYLDVIFWIGDKRVKIIDSTDLYNLRLIIPKLETNLLLWCGVFSFTLTKVKNIVVKDERTILELKEIVI